MKVYVVLTDELDEFGNTFQDFHGVFSSIEEAEDIKKSHDTYVDGELLVEHARIEEYEV